MRAPALGTAIHLTVAAVSFGGVAMAAVAIELGSRNAPVPFYSYAVPVAVLAIVAMVLRAWWRRRWPFDAEPRRPRQVTRMLVAALAGGAVGAYTGLLSDWFYDVAMDLVWFTLLPLCVAACGGRGMLRGIACVAALHLGAEIGAQMGYGDPFGVSWTVTRNHLPYVPVSFGGFLAWELLLRKLGRRLTRRELPAQPDEATPRRAR